MSRRVEIVDMHPYYLIYLDKKLRYLGSFDLYTTSCNTLDFEALRLAVCRDNAFDALGVNM